MTTARSGPTATLIKGSGTSLDGQVLIVGGSTGSSFLSLVSAASGSSVPQFGQVAQNTAELYDPITDTFTANRNDSGMRDGNDTSGCDSCDCGGPESPITAATESGTTVTITSAVNRRPDHW